VTAGERIAGQLWRSVPTGLLLAGGAFLAAGRMLRWLAVHTAVAGVLALVLLTWWAADRIGWLWLAFATGCICIGLGAVMELRPRWWLTLTRAAASRRRLAWYRRRWEPAMVGAGLTLGDDLPRLVGHRFGGQLHWERDLDVLTVATLPGQVLEDWRHVAPRLAAAWGRTRVRPHLVRSGTAPAMLELFCSSRPQPATAAARRAAVAGGQVVVTGVTEAGRRAIAESTAVDEAVDDPPRGAFPRTPRAER
jgi:hypothetical protein